MDFKQLEYILEIAKENNITKAARNLYISQSALNQQLLKLEKELGTQLFYRSRTDWHPTEAGEIYLQGARAAMKIKIDTYKRIAEITHSEKSELKIGLTNGRGIQMFTAIYPVLHQKYPSLSILPLEMGASAIQEAIQDNEIDIGFLVLADNQRTHAEYVAIGKEEMILLVPASDPICASSAQTSDKLPAIDIKLLKDRSFTLMYHRSSIRQICDEIFENAGVQPNILLETSNTSSISEMVSTGLCCGIVPRYYADTSNPNYRCFALKNHPTRTLCISYQKSGFLTDASREFITLSKNYWKSRLPRIQDS